MKLRQCSQCKTPVKLQNSVIQFVCLKCGSTESVASPDFRARVSLTRAMAREDVKPLVSQTDFTRSSFIQITAPRKQRCACGCGEWIQKDQIVFARMMVAKGKPAGQTRIIDLDDHYERWISNTASTYARKASAKNPRMKQYLGDL